MRQLPKYRQHNEVELVKSGCVSSNDSAKIVKYSGFCLIDQKRWINPKPFFIISGSTVKDVKFDINLDLDNAKNLVNILQSFIRQAEKEIETEQLNKAHQSMLECLNQKWCEEAQGKQNERN